MIKRNLIYLGSSTSLSTDLEKALEDSDYNFICQDSIRLKQPTDWKDHRRTIKYMVVVDTATVDALNLDHVKSHMDAGAFFLFIDSSGYNPRGTWTLQENNELSLVERLEGMMKPSEYAYQMGSVSLSLQDYLGKNIWDLSRREVNFDLRNWHGKIMNDEQIAKALEAEKGLDFLYKAQHLDFEIDKIDKTSLRSWLKGVSFKKIKEITYSQWDKIREKYKEKHFLDIFLGKCLNRLKESPIQVLENFQISIPANMQEIYLNRILFDIGAAYENPKPIETRKKYTVKTTYLSRKNKERIINHFNSDKEMNKLFPDFYDLYLQTFDRFFQKTGITPDDTKTRAKRIAHYDFFLTVHDEQDKTIGMFYYAYQPNFTEMDNFWVPISHLYSSDEVAYLGGIMVNGGNSHKQHIINILFETLYATLKIKKDPQRHYWKSNENSHIFIPIHEEAVHARKMALDNQFRLHDWFFIDFWKEEEKEEDLLKHYFSMNPIAWMGMDQKRVLNLFAHLESKFSKDEPTHYKMFSKELSYKHFDLRKALITGHLPYEFDNSTVRDSFFY